MPNWCYNTMRISGPVDDVARFKRTAVGFSPWCKPLPAEKPDVLCFHNFVSIPSKVLAAGYSDAGYNWEWKHWGCKWGACHSVVQAENQESIIYEFDTAWSPPLEFLRQVSAKWPTLLFSLRYQEETDEYDGEAEAQAGAIREK